MKTRLVAREEGVQKQKSRAYGRGFQNVCWLVKLYSYCPHLPLRMAVMVEETRFTHFWWLEQ